MNQSKVDYGFDAPGIILGLGTAGAAALAVSALVPAAIRPYLWWSAAPLCANSALMALYSKVGKFRHRDRMLDLVDWRGDETVLDVGTGRGVLLTGAARRLKRGRATGIDIWSAKDLSGNSATNTLANARVEGVADRVEVVSADACRMPFADSSFDIVLSNLCLHNIPTAEGRAAAVKEIARVLKPGGEALISDFMYTGQYAKVFRAAGLTAERLGPYWLSTFPPLRIVRAKRKR